MDPLRHHIPDTTAEMSETEQDGDTRGDEPQYFLGSDWHSAVELSTSYQCMSGQIHRRFWLQIFKICFKLFFFFFFII